MFGVVISFYQRVSSHRRGHDNSPLLHSLKFCLSLLKANPEISQIVVADGSPLPNDDVRMSCAEFDADYFHAGREMTFAETYNAGAEKCKTEWICLLASDVYVRTDTFSRIKAFIGSRAEPGLIGAIIPYLSVSDLRGQQAATAGPTCISPLMTINLNVFRKATFESVNGVPEGFSGCYNDIVLAYRLKRAGKKIYLMNVHAIHYGRLTTLSGSSRVNYETDNEKFLRTFPDLALPGSVWGVDFTRFCDDRTFHKKYAAAMAIPDKIARHAEIERLIAMPPFLRPLDTADGD